MLAFHCLQRPSKMIMKPRFCFGRIAQHRKAETRFLKFLNMPQQSNTEILSLKFLPLDQLPNAFAQLFLDNEDIF